MIVTEGADSKHVRMLYILIGPFLVAMSTLFFVQAPTGLLYANCLSTIIAVSILMRFLLLSVILRFTRNESRTAPPEYPSIAFVIPCLNESDVLKHTVPLMNSLEYDGQLCFCYVVETASTDDSRVYLQHFSDKDQRFIVIPKRSIPNGRGCSINYGLSRIPKTEIVAFLDADHTIDQCSLNRVASAFSGTNRPIALQGRCLARNGQSTSLANVLAIERQWLEQIELVANPAIGGICYYGGGQGFLSRAIFDDLGFAIDEDMILDDIDLSCLLALNGVDIVCSLDIETVSLQPERLKDLLDQRARWIRGWLDVSHKYLLQAFRKRGVSLLLRLDMARFLLYPFGGALFCVLWGAAFASLLHPKDVHMCTRHLAYISLIWPLATGVLPFCAYTSKKRSQTDYILTLVGIPVLFVVNCLLFGSAVVEKYVLQRAAHYCKASKKERV